MRGLFLLLICLCASCTTASLEPADEVLHIYGLVRIEAEHCSVDEDCVLMEGVRCFDPCGAISVNRCLVKNLRLLEMRYLEEGGQSCVVARCVESVPLPICKDGRCSIEYLPSPALTLDRQRQRMGLKWKDLATR